MDGRLANLTWMDPKTKEAARAKLAQAETEAIEALAPFGPRADVLREAAIFVVKHAGFADH